MRGLMTEAAVLAEDWKPSPFAVAHLSGGRGGSLLDGLPLPIRPKQPQPGRSHVQYTCPSCGGRARVLVEGGADPGDEIGAGCPLKDCAAASDVRVREAMFS